MSDFRPADDREVSQLWPAVRQMRLFRTADEFRAFREAAPWRVRVSRRGDASVLAPWRAHLDILAMRALWAPTWRVREALADAREVARTHGFGRVLSPLLDVELLRPYLAEGMAETERIIALQAPPALVRQVPAPERIELHTGTEEALWAVYGLDRKCFTEFWQHTEADELDLGPGTRLTLAIWTGAAASAFGGPELVGYTLATTVGDTVTIARLAVAEGARRRGVASALLADVASWAGRQRAEMLTLTTQEANAASRALYARAGFAELPGRYAFALGSADDGEAGSAGDGVGSGTDDSTRNGEGARA